MQITQPCSPPLGLEPKVGTLIRVMVAEAVPMVREALARLLDLEDDCEVVAAVGDGDAIVPSALRYRPDVVVIEIALPKRHGLDAARELHERLPDCKVLILTGAATPNDLRRGAESRVAGFMLKSSTPHELIDGVRTVVRGGSVIEPTLAYAALNVPDNPLTDREQDVLRLTAAGFSTRDVAETLYLSHGTVRNYLASVVTKLNARNRIDAIRLAREAGWLGRSVNNAPQTGAAATATRTVRGGSVDTASTSHRAGEEEACGYW